MIVKENGLAGYKILDGGNVSDPDLLYLDDFSDPLDDLSPDGYTATGDGSFDLGGLFTGISDWLGKLDPNKLFDLFGGGGTTAPVTPPVVPDGTGENTGTDIGSILSNPMVITGLIIGTVLLIKK